MKSIQDILPLTEQPSRYLGSEINRIRKAPESVRLRIALAFPDMYEIGTSHFGIQILYDILNNRPDIAAERVFAPGTDMEQHLRVASLPLVSQESHTPLHQFDIIGFSLLYELNFTNILTMLDLAGIPFFASARTDSRFPLIIAGGPCTCNPEPVAEFFDAMVLGDGEEVILKMAQVWDQSKDKSEILKVWSQIEGVYIPSFFEPGTVQPRDGFTLQTLSPKSPDYIKVRRTIVNNLDTAPFPKSPIIPYGKPVHDRLRLEISRGCTRGCRFCQAGMIYRPVRERSPETVLSLCDAALAQTGYEDISLLSLSTGDYTCIGPLMEQLMSRYAADHVAVSFPSLRAGTLTPELMKLIKQVRKTGFTIAPEAGSQRLRDVINKNITEEEIITTVEDAFRLGWQVIKLYFMVGLPTETQEDLEAIVDLVKKLWKIKNPKGRKGKLNVGIGTFIPKAHTPFQWARQLSLTESKEKIRWLQDRLNLPGIHLKWQNPEMSMLEGLLSRGDRRLSRVIAAAYQKGCKFDGWSDKLQYALWEEAISDEGIDANVYTSRERDLTEPLPWDHVDMRVTKDFLKAEWEKAIQGEHTPDCRDHDNCNACGVCDFEQIQPQIFNSQGSAKSPPAPLCERGEELTPLHQSVPPFGKGGRGDFESEKSELGLESPPAPLCERGESTASGFKKLNVSYSKRGQAKYFGHLELVNIFLRAIRRARISLKYSEGFHPMPKISFDDPLPVGLESLKEYFRLTVANTVSPESLVSELNKQLPEGLVILDCQTVLGKNSRSAPESVRYQIKLKDQAFDEAALERFISSPEFILSRVRKGKLRKTNLKEMVLKIELTEPNTLEMILKSETGKTVRPFEAVKAIFDLPEETLKQAEMVKG